MPQDDSVAVRIGSSTVAMTPGFTITERAGEQPGVVVGHEDQLPHRRQCQAPQRHVAERRRAVGVPAEPLSDLRTLAGIARHNGREPAGSDDHPELGVDKIAGHRRCRRRDRRIGESRIEGDQLDDTSRRHVRTVRIRAVSVNVRNGAGGRGPR